MIKSTLITLIVTVFTALPLAASEKTGRQATVVFFAFDASSMPEAGKHGYWSAVLPRTLSQYLKKESVTATLKTGSVISFGTPENEPGSEELIDAIEKKKNEYGDADFVVAGTIRMEESRPVISVFIFNTVSGESAFLRQDNIETGALLRDSMDDLAEKLQKSLTMYSKANDLLLEPSPYIPLYGFFSVFTFGMDAGRLMFMESGKTEYEDGWQVTSHLRIDTSRLIGATALRLNFGFFSSDNSDTADSIYYTDLKVYEATGEIEVAPRLFWRIHLCLSAGGGYSFSRIREIDSSASTGPSVSVLGQSRLNKPLATGTAAIMVNMKPLVIRFGSTYRRIFNDSPMDTLCLFAGAGYSI